MFCMNCGTEISDNARFCRSCGKPVEADAAGGVKLAASQENAVEAAAVIENDYSDWNALVNLGKIIDFKEDSVGQMLAGILNGEVEFFLLVPPGFVKADFSVSPPGLSAVNYMTARADGSGRLHIELCTATGSVAFGAPAPAAGDKPQATLCGADGVALRDAEMMFLVYLRDRQLPDAPGGWNVIRREEI